MPSASDPIIVIRGHERPIPAVAAAAAEAGWPIWQTKPIGDLLRRLFLERPEVAVLETNAAHGPLLRTLRDRRPELSLVAVSHDEPEAELVALAAGAHAWLASAAGSDAIRNTAELLRQTRAPMTPPELVARVVPVLDDGRSRRKRFAVGVSKSRG